MKIAALASGQGEKIVHLYDFFKEGNRLTIDCVIVTPADTPVAETFRNNGITVFTLPEDGDFSTILFKLQADDVKLLVVDGFTGDVPTELKDFFGSRIVYPTSASAAPMEVINVAEHSDEPKVTVTPQPKEEAPFGQSNASSEWAAVFQPAQPNQPAQPTQPVISPAPQQQQETQPETPQQPFTQLPPNPYGNPYRPAPQGVAMQQNEPMPDTYLVWSVIITILFSMIPGIIAIIFSTKVSSKYYMGNIEGAKRCSRNAQIWCIVSIILGILWMTFYLPLVLIAS